MIRLLASSLVTLLVVWRLNATWLEALSVGVSVYLFLIFIHHMGSRIALLECIGFIASLEILLVPAITYWVFPASMPIESDTYLRYSLPACLAFCVGLFSFRHRPLHSHRHYLQQVQGYLKDKQLAPIILLIIGLVGFLCKTFLPNAPSFITTLPTYCLFISAFYSYYTGHRQRLLIIGIVTVVLLYVTVRAGMFGELFFWTMLLTLFGIVNKPNPLTNRTKAIFVVVGFTILLLIQSIKGEYRYHTWGYRQNERSGNAWLLANLIDDRLHHPEKLFNADHLFLSFVRFNQGIMIGNAMAKVPMHEPFANGEVLLSLAYPLVPRIVWPNKPQTGGYQNIRRFTTLPQNENTSINLSPLGEGYVNFGFGGVFFALFYGLLLGGVFQYVFQLSEQNPSLILWLPMLFIGCLTMETDVLSTWGSLVNSAIFIGLLFWVLRRVGIQL